MILDCIETIEKSATTLYDSNFLRIFVGGVAFYFTYQQLKCAKKNMLLNIAKNEIDIFNKLDERQKLLTECQMKFSDIKDNDDKSKYLKEQLTTEEQYLKEHYLNLLDTVCFYANNNHITAKNFYLQYKDILFAVNELYIEKDTRKYEKYKNIREAIKIIENR